MTYRTISSRRQAARDASGLAQSKNLSMSSGILSQLALVVGSSDKLAVANEDRTDWHIVVFKRSLGLAQSQAHEVDIVLAR